MRGVFVVRIGRAALRVVLGLASGALVRGAAIVSPIASTACACPASGAAVVVDADVVERGSKLSVAGACEPKNVSCLGRDGKDRCTTFWIDAQTSGTCHVVATLDDGVRLERTIELEVDEAYPCRGNVRPREDGALRISAR
jgi:hypothetical protein